MSYLVVVGSYNQDFVWRTPTFPVPGETRLGTFSTGAGGKGFNQAVAAARQGANVQFIGALGRDTIGESAAQLAVQEQIQAHWQWCAEHPSGNAAIVLNGEGQNLIIVGAGANLALSTAHIQTHAGVLQHSTVVLTQHEVNWDATRLALQLARKAGAITVHNPAPPLPEENGALLPWVDILTPNETEFAHLLASCAEVQVDANTLSLLDDDALHQLARQLNVPTLVITLGAAGVFVSHGDNSHWNDRSTHYRLPAEKVTPLDTTGAGDAFSGSLCAALTTLGNAHFEDAVRHANRVAGVSTESAGASPSMPTRTAIEKRFG